MAGVKMNETCFVFIGSSENDRLLKDPVELPISTAGVNVPMLPYQYSHLMVDLKKFRFKLYYCVFLLHRKQYYHTDNNENMANEIVVAQKLRRISVIFCLMHLYNEYHFVVVPSKSFSILPYTQLFQF
jgi:hypothetical protein